MQTQEKIEAIRVACIAANPAIMELVMGCEVWIDDMKGEGQYSIWKYIGDVDTHNNQDTIWQCVFSTFATVKWGNFKLEGKPHVILGRPIRLADVLLAIGKESSPAKYTSWLDDECFETPHFLLSRKTEMSYDEAPILDWNLLKDDLRDQSPETVDFLFSLLKA